MDALTDFLVMTADLVHFAKMRSQISVKMVALASKLNVYVSLQRQRFLYLFLFVRQIGDAAITCLCPNGFKGSKCELYDFVEEVYGKCYIH